MKRLILGTAGHIDHGKTALVRALTGVDTDRLKEEKERGITIDLGFAELADEEVRLGVVDVPGHEGFIRNMLAGATGMDVVVLVVAADEGVMPQTREHLAIVRLLGVESLVVALTKVDLVEEAWLELVRDEVGELLDEAGLGGAPLIATSARTGRGLDQLGAALRDAAATVREGDASDLVRLPVDRVFTVRGTGTVVTGTLWSGRLGSGDEVVVRPGGRRVRVRGMQVHGQDVDEAVAGERTAVALAGSGVDVESLARGDVVVDLPDWPESHMLTVLATLLEGPGWPLEHNQRVRVHLGTAEVMARVALLEDRAAIPPGGSGWVQLRLESPVVARARDRLVLRSYSPVTTIGGGTVAEAAPPKRKELAEGVEALLRAVLDGGGTAAATGAVLELAGWSGAATAALPVHTGLPPGLVDAAVVDLFSAGACAVGDALIGPRAAREGEQLLATAVEAFHRNQPLRPGLPLEVLRDALPERAPSGTTDRLLERLVARRRVERRGDVVAAVGFEPVLTGEQEGVREGLRRTYAEAGLAPPSVEELPAGLADHADLWPLLKLLEAEGALVALEDGFFVDAAALDEASRSVRRTLGGRSGLGPTDFRDVLPVSRRHLIPLLGWMDRSGVTVRRADGREVPAD